MNNDTITAKVIKELMVLKDTSEVRKELTLVWTQRVEAQRAQNAVLEILRDAKDFDLIRDGQRTGQNRQQKGNKLTENCIYCRMIHLYRKMNSIWQKCSG